MKLVLGLLTILLFLLACGFYVYGAMEREVNFIDEYENTAAEKRDAVADAFRQSSHIDKWTIASGLCALAAVGSGVASFKVKGKPYKTS